MPRQLRSILAQLRLGILPLYIETGRYKTKIDPVTGKRRNLKSEERLCELCDTNSVEDEFHFIFCCNFYINERKYYFDKICKQNPKFQEMDNTNKIIYLFEYDCKNFARFVTHIWNKQKKDYMFEYSIRNAIHYIFVLNCLHFLFMWLTPTFCYLY